MNFHSLKRGFTLIELLLVIGIIAILAAIVIVAINPTKQLGDARNAQRRSDVNTILNAVYQFSIDNKGALPGAITATPTGICKSTVTGAACTGAPTNGIDLLALTPTYIISLPIDPSPLPTGVSANLTYYNISVAAGNRVTVTALGAEQGASISVTR